VTSHLAPFDIWLGGYKHYDPLGFTFLAYSLEFIALF